MKNSLNRLTAALACATLIVGLTLPAKAAEMANSIRVSSYKGNTLQVGDRSGLIIGGEARAVTSTSPEIVAVENVGGFWVAVAKSDGMAVLTATGHAGETASLTLTVGDPTPSSSQTTAEAPVPVTELDKVRQEIVRLVNEVRRENGVSELTVNDALMNAAQEQAETLYTYHRMKEECEAALAHGYCYELHIIVKRPASVKRVSFLLREDIAKLDRLDAETRFLGKRHISTIGELTACREQSAAEIDTLTAQRRELRNRLKRLSREGDTIAVNEVRGKISVISNRLKALRREVVLCDGIAQRSGQVKDNLERLLKQKETERRELNEHELFRRRGGASRENVAGNR